MGIRTAEVLSPFDDFYYYAPDIEPEPSTHIPAMQLPPFNPVDLPKDSFINILRSMSQEDQYLHKASSRWKQLLDEKAFAINSATVSTIDSFLVRLNAHAQNQRDLYTHLTVWIARAENPSETFKELEPFILKCREFENTARTHFRPLIAPLEDCIERRSNSGIPWSKFIIPLSKIKNLLSQCYTNSAQAEACYALLKTRGKAIATCQKAQIDKISFRPTYPITHSIQNLSEKMQRMEAADQYLYNVSQRWFEILKARDRTVKTYEEFSFSMLDGFLAHFKTHSNNVAKLYAHIVRDIEFSENPSKTLESYQQLLRKCHQFEKSAREHFRPFLQQVYDDNYLQRALQLYPHRTEDTFDRSTENHDKCFSSKIIAEGAYLALMNRIIMVFKQNSAAASSK